MYAELINQKISQVHQKGVASKILQSMDRIRNEFDPVQARRWPTELLQNARDLAYPQRPVRVQFELTDDAVYFRHSGKPFSVKDIIAIPPQEENKEWSSSWVRGHIYDSLYAFLSGQKLLSVGEERRALCERELYPVSAEDPKTRTALAALCAQIRGVLVPEDETDWYAAFSNYVPPKDKVAVLESVLEQARKIVHHGLKEGTPSQWLAHLYDLAMEDDTAAAAICAGNTAISPCQKGDDLSWGNLYTARELYLDPGIPEILKDTSEHLDGLEANHRLGIRSRLLCLDFQPTHKEGLPPAYPISSFVNYIVTRSDRKFPVKNFSTYGASYEKMWREAWKLLLASGPDGDMYRLA